MGAGHGRCGHGPCGHGPWVSWPYVPGLSTTDELSYAVNPVQFEDLTEQRFLRSQDRGLTIGYQFPAADSATVLGISSFYQAAGLARFLVTDYQTNLAQVGRFAEPLTTIRGGAQTRQLACTFRVSRPQTYAEVVYANSPVAYWRMNDATGASTLTDVMNACHGQVVAGITFQVSGALTDDPNRALQSAQTASGLILGSSSLAIFQAFTVVGYVQQTPDVSSGTHGLLFCARPGGSPSICTLKNGYFTVEEANLATSTAFTSDGNWHQVAWRAVRSSSWSLFQDGADVTNSGYQLSGSFGVTSLALCSASGAFFAAANLDEWAVFPYSMTTATIQRLARIGARL